MTKTSKISKETIGAWIIHHGRKIGLFAGAASEFPAIDEAAKAAILLTVLGETNQVTISKSQVEAVARASGLNPRYELNALLTLLQKKRLIEQSADSVSILGITNRGSLLHAADIYRDAEPSSYEEASITLAEAASVAPVRRADVIEVIGDKHKLSRAKSNDFLVRAEEVGFVDKEGKGDDSVLYNGNLFRRESVEKTARVLDSLSNAERQRVIEANAELRKSGCIQAEVAERILSRRLLQKLVAASIYDFNQVMNDRGNYVFMSSPAAFHKFVDPMVDDCFDMAKALVAALTYGMTLRSPVHGRISDLPVLLGKLVGGSEIGPATAIGQDYRVLEINRVVKIRPDRNFPKRFYMKLLKREVGELALEVLTEGDANAQSVSNFGSAPMSAYVGPEESRVSVRKKQSKPNKRQMRDLLESIRAGQNLR